MQTRQWRECLPCRHERRRERIYRKRSTILVFVQGSTIYIFTLQITEFAYLLSSNRVKGGWARSEPSLTCDCSIQKKLIWHVHVPIVSMFAECSCNYLIFFKPANVFNRSYLMAQLVLAIENGTAVLQHRSRHVFICHVDYKAPSYKWVAGCLLQLDDEPSSEFIITVVTLTPIIMNVIALHGFATTITWYSEQDSVESI